MPIASLSEDTANVITSYLVLNNAISAVKELIDNALDSRASNISVEISANTLDAIQVKDNGFGIGLEDRQLLCKRGYTSKIRTLEDLAGLGGSSLGFRGEALASIAELSESLTFITRVEGELAGTLLRFDSKGKLVSSSSASHGTGTTVKIQNFLKAVPVRQQAALKKAPKLLADIKHLLFEYAFARPKVRFQLKILKSKGDFKGNWSYAASQDDTNLSLVASKIVGKEIVKTCEHERVSSLDEGYTINALLLSNLQTRPTSTDQFISIDGRPLNADGNLMRDLHKIYKSYAKGQVSDQDMLPRRLFLVVRLTCPKGSYDINIEPAKNEVMFEDMQIVTDLFEQLCRRLYGEISKGEASSKKPSGQALLKQRPFDILLAKRPADAVNLREDHDHADHPGGSEVHLDIDIQSMSGHSSFASSPQPQDTLNRMSRVDVDTRPEHDPGKMPSRSSDIDTETDLMQPELTNPFVLAKLNTRVVRHNEQDCPNNRSVSRAPIVACEQGRPNSTNVTTSPKLTARPLDHVTTASPSPNTQSSVPNLVSVDSTAPITQGIHGNILEQVLSRSAIAQTGPPDLLPLNFNVQAAASLSPTASTASGLIDVRRSEPIDAPFGKAKQQPAGIQASPVSTGTLQKSFRTPFKKSTSVTCSTDPSTITSYPTPNSMSKTSGLAPNYSRDSHQPMHTNESGSELEDIMEFEHRKRSHILQHKLRNQLSKANGPQQDRSASGEVLCHIVDDTNATNITSSKALYEARFTPGERIKNDDTQSQKKTCSSESNARSESLGTRLEEDQTISTDAALPRICSYSNVVFKSQPQISEQMHPSDPRALLVRIRAQSSDGEPAGRFIKSKIAKLPFESIPEDSLTYTTRAFLVDKTDFSLKFLVKQHKMLQNHDEEYTRFGKIQTIMTDSSTSEVILETNKAAALQMVQDR